MTGHDNTHPSQDSIAVGPLAPLEILPVTRLQYWSKPMRTSMSSTPDSGDESAIYIQPHKVGVEMLVCDNGLGTHRVTDVRNYHCC